MMLGIARILGETAPVLLLVGVTDSINPNPFSNAQGSLPLFIFSESQNSVQTAINRGWAAALTLIILVMQLNLIARLIAWWKAPAAAR
jgi:phosphate transport system permease protein